MNLSSIFKCESNIVKINTRKYVLIKQTFVAATIGEGHVVNESRRNPLCKRKQRREKRERPEEEVREAIFQLLLAMHASLKKHKIFTITI